MQLFDYDESEVTGRWFGEFLAPEYVEHFRQNFSQFKAIGKISGVHFKIVKKDGLIVDVLLEGRIGRDNAGEFQQTHCILEDITQRMLTDEKLLAVKSLQRTVFDSLDGALHLIDSDLRFNLFNLKFRGWAEKYGLETDVIGKTIQEVFPFLTDDVVTQYQQVLKTGESITTEEETTFDDQVIVTETRKIPVKTGDKTTSILTIITDISERKLVEEALWESEEKFKNLSNLTFEGILIHNKGVAIDVNESLPKMFGYKREEIIGKNLIELLILREFHALVKENLVKSAVKPYEVMARKKDGTLIQIEIEAKEVKDTNENLRVTALRDITDRKQAEQDRELSRSLLKASLESTADGILVVATDGSWTSFNQKFVDMWGIPSSIGESGDDKAALKYVLDSLAEPDEFVAKVGELYADPEKESFDTIKMKDGRIFERFSQPQRLGEKIVGRVWSFRNVTAQKQAEAALIREKNRATSIIEGTNAGTWDWNVQTGELILNERWAEIMGYTLDELEPIDVQTWLMNVHSDDLPIAQAQLDKHFTGKLDYYDVVFRQPHKNGGWVWVNARGKVVKWTKDGKPLRMSGTHLDITERKQLEDQLRHSQKLESIAKLTGGIAHDFNNILGAIFGSVDMILMHVPEDHPSRRFAHVIMDKSQKAADLVKQMLAYSSRQRLTVKPMIINQAIEDLSLLLTRALEERIELELQLADDLKPINGDKTAIDQIVMNLCINAADAMKKGGKLTVRTENLKNIEEYNQQHPELKPGQYVLLSIADTGHGIEPEHLEHIFEPFFTTREVGEGTGLGLSMVFGLVKQHKGYTFCESELGKGTVFEVLFPIMEKQQPTTEMETLTGQIYRGSGTIMVVEDEKDLIEILELMLTELNYDIITASNGAKALQLYRDIGKQVDLVLSDVIMPQMGGKELYEELKKIDPEVKFLFTSGYTNRGFYKKYDIDPDIKILSKPFRLKEVSERVKEALNQG